MTDALVEKVSNAVRPHLYWEGGASSVVARAAIIAVLEHFSELGNVTDGMADARITELNIDDVRSSHRTAIAAAMRAAKEEFLK